MQKIELLDYIFGIASFIKHIFKYADNSDIEPAMNRTQEKVLMMIALKSPVAMTKVSEKFGLEKGSFTQIADSLERLNYIRRERSDEDRRIILLQITPAGMEIANKIHMRTKVIINDHLSKLTKNEQEELFASLKSVNKYISIMLGKELKNEKAD